ncbi:MAG: SCO family protein [Gammaproteobacteria bacterium]|jgi:cytochrome oxidase Cu insertion factor (SCO1/SenC/PrrC family)
MTMAANDKPTQAQGRGALIGLAALFFIPLLGAFWLYYAGGWRPAGSTNHGELITPARPLPVAAFSLTDGSAASADLLRGKWTLVYIGDGRCDEPCRKALWTMRQTRLLLAEDMDRVQRVFVAENNCCARAFLAKEHPGLAAITPADDSARAWLAEFPQTTSAKEFIFVVDPLGNLMMRFDVTQNPKGLLQDLEKLLKLSHIG